jgi:hypothetical protein
VLLPFFFDSTTSSQPLNENHKHVYDKTSGEQVSLCGCTDEKRCVLVSVKVLENMVDLFDKEYRDHDSKYPFCLTLADYDISNCVVHVMDVASKLHEIELNEEMIGADIVNLQGVATDEEMLVAALYVAECFTFGREPDLENVDLDFQRKHIVDVILGLINLN